MIPLVADNLNLVGQGCDNLTGNVSIAETDDATLSFVGLAFNCFNKNCCTSSRTEQEVGGDGESGPLILCSMRLG